MYYKNTVEIRLKLCNKTGIDIKNYIIKILKYNKS